VYTGTTTSREASTEALLWRQGDMCTDTAIGIESERHI
jgi:hypothetical protein